MCFDPKIAEEVGNNLIFWHPNPLRHPDVSSSYLSWISTK